MNRGSALATKTAGIALLSYFSITLCTLWPSVIRVTRSLKAGIIRKTGDWLKRNVARQRSGGERS